MPKRFNVVQAANRPEYPAYRVINLADFLAPIL